MGHPKRRSRTHGSVAAPEQRTKRLRMFCRSRWQAGDCGVVGRICQDVAAETSGLNFTEEDRCRD